jgi:ribose-phosphate pyrophosphokinase
MILTFNFPENTGLDQFNMFRYPGGEVQVRLTELAVRYLTRLNPETDNVIVIARIQDGEIVSIAQLLDAIRSVTAANVQLILPYLPYGRADRRFVEGDSDGLAVFGRLLGMMAYDIVTLDAHSPKAVRNIRHLLDVSPKPIIEQVLQMIPGSTNILLPDNGARRYGFGDLSAEKQRDPATGKLSGFKVPDKAAFGADNILIIDDICDGGRTFIGIADALREAGVYKPLYLYVTHGIFSQGIGELLHRFEHIYTTDSFNNEPWNSNRLTRIPCALTIVSAIKNRNAK